ncbi:S8 family serine peptidase [Ekhidna sp. MALMAid0563]|uniref:S8 family serine peptidase n=1 Tax=Ekhidna sp. MALMAid0563 TaxID=3143937 RepID=UPI0032DE9BDB
MIRLITILLLSSTFLNSYSQGRKLLKPQDFEDQKINSEWVYVKYKPNVDLPARNSNIRNLKVSKAEGLLSHMVKMRVPDGMDPITFCNKLRKQTDYVYADPIVRYELLSTSDPLIDNQYYLENIQAFEAWTVTQGDDDLTIGIIDSGLDLDHEDIVNNLWLNTADPIDGNDNDGNGYTDDYYGYDFADEDNDPSIQNGNHGMIVGGIASASANNGKGIAGVGYNTKIAALKGFKSSSGTDGGLYEAVTYAAENGIDVLNLSWGRMGTPLQSEQDIINDAVLNHDVVIVAAAGNEGGKPTEENLWYPASYDNVLSVGASDANDNKSSGSTFNYAVDLIAPGVSMYSTVSNNGYANGGPGTSYAAPLVAGTAALVKDVFPNLSAIQIMERVRATADDIYDIGNNANFDGKLGKGRLNAFRAVSESNVKSLRASTPSLTSNYGAVAFFGDTVQVTATITNHLSAVNNPTLTISSPNSDFTISQGTFFPGYMGTAETKEISFEVVLDEDLEPESTINFRIDYVETGYSDFQFLSVTTSPDYADFGNERISMTISGDGDLGFNEYGPNFEGTGFQYQLDTLMTYTGLMLATNSSSVSDNIVTNYTNQARDQDFQVQQNYKLYHHQGADYFGYSEFTDSNHPLIIEQSNLTWDSEDYLIIRYRIVNNSASPINNLSFGVFADWDLDDPTSNYAVFDGTNEYIYARNATSNLFAAVKVIGGDNLEYSALDMGAFNGNTQDINDLFSDATKYDFLVNQNKLMAGSVGAGNDVATINGVTITQLEAYDETYIDVIYAIADSKANLDAEVQDAANRINQFIQKPRVLETFYTCDGSATINPTAGTNYDFYEDPLAQTFISSGSSLAVNVSKDSLFYVKNTDENYPSDVFELRVKLLSDIADFEMSTDTLYLDHPTTNVVQFTDLSLDAVSWDWNFDQGTTTTLQNPSLSFSEARTYQISLSIENAQGCTDMITKDLLVANRPDAPVLSDQTICPGESVIVDDPSAEKIHIYRFEDQVLPTLSGSNLEIPSILYDTTVYVSGVYGSFESAKVPLGIDVLEVSGNLKIEPDTTSESHQMLLSANNLDAGATIRWFVDSELSGTTSTITVSAVEGDIDISLEITSADDCMKTIDKSITISSSPFASHPDIITCTDEATLVPENGSYFGFYTDPDLIQLIKKGTQLTTTAYDKVYVVSLDDGLPGMPIEVNIDQEIIELDIALVTNPIGSKHEVNLFAVTNNVIDSYQWFINGELSETISNPTFFLNDGQQFEIVLNVTTEAGCSESDTLQLDFTTPLGLASPDQTIIYPNPSDGFIHIQGQDKLEAIRIISLQGKVVWKLDNPGARLDLSDLTGGVYLLKINTESEEIKTTLIIR